VEEAVIAANSEDGAFVEGSRVKPEGPHGGQSLFPAAESSDPHPAPASLFESFLSRENLARALKRVEQNHGAPGPDGMKTVSFGMLGEPPDAGPHVRWCGRGRGEPGPYPNSPRVVRTGIPAAGYGATDGCLSALESTRT